jgi:glucose/arabinose dehydrogenase
MRVSPRALAATLVAAGALSAAPAALAAPGGPPPPPTAPGGQKVTMVAAGLTTPTSFAVGRGQLFEGDGGSEKGTPPGGVFAIRNGTGTRLAGSPFFVSGLAWHHGSLYVSGGNPTGKTGGVFFVQRWSGWNGSQFKSRTTVWAAPKGTNGLNGIAFGPDGRLYVGADVGLFGGADHGPAITPYVYDLMSMKADGSDLQVFATGMRQPWQIAFAKGDPDPFVSDLNQDKGPKAAANGPDWVLHVHRGDNYGFPQCNGTQGASLCSGFATPMATFAPHSDIMGMAIIGKTLYMTSFASLGAKGPGGEVLSMPLSGGTPKPVLTGFVAPTVGLGTDGHTLYVGELTGQVFSVTP